MIEFYLPLRHLHIGCAVLSIGLFALRGALLAVGYLVTVARAHHPLGLLAA